LIPSIMKAHQIQAAERLRTAKRKPASKSRSA
jgi:hypothetical protein